MFLTKKSLIACAALAQASDAFEFLPPFVGQPCTVNKKGQMPPGACGTGTENAPDPALSCLDPNTNKPFRHHHGHDDRTGYCGTASDPYLGAACTGGLLGSCGNGVEKPTGYSCDDPNNQGTAAADEEDGQCMQTEPTYWGNPCGKPNAVGECGAGLPPQYSSTKDWFCLKPTGQDAGYCTLKCTQGTQNACGDGFSCQNQPGTRDSPAVGSPGVCVKDEPKKPSIWGQKCKRGEMGICGRGEDQEDSDGDDGSFVCFRSYCTQFCNEGTRSPCPDGFKCKTGFHPFSSRVGSRGLCVKED